VTRTRPAEAEDRIGQSANCHLLSAPINNFQPLYYLKVPAVVAKKDQAVAKTGAPLATGEVKVREHSS
jgi:hypothetical protein